MAAIYNDTERFACDWLQHLMDAGLIMPGKIDDRSIADLSPDDLAGFERVHLFAGIGGWDLALQLAEWPAGRPVWTCSCPCPPFSQAGKRQSCQRCAGANLVWCPRRTGYCICADCRHAWLADGRHLWPEAWRLIARSRPPVVFGEQVASPDGLEWLAGVRASLEILSYAPWGTDYPAAGVRSPNIRQRLFWLADANGGIAGNGHLQPSGQHGQQPQDGRAGGMADNDAGRRGERSEGPELQQSPYGRRQPVAGDRSVCGLADSHEGQCRRLADREGCQRDGTAAGWIEGDRVAQSGCAAHWLADSTSDRCREERPQDGRVAAGDRTEGRAAGLVPGGEPADFWGDFDIVHCTDGKARRVPQSSLLRLADGLSDGVVRGGFEGAEGFPLAEGAGNRVGRLRGYGNAINPYAAARFIRAWREVRAA